MPTLTVSEQHHRAGSPLRQEAHWVRSDLICEPCLRVGCLMPAISPYSCPHSLICDTTVLRLRPSSLMAAFRSDDLFFAQGFPNRAQVGKLHLGIFAGDD